MLSPGDETLYITFQAGRIGFAVPMEGIEEVLPGRDVRPLWGCHPWVVGVLVRRGRVVGVVDPARLAGEAGGDGGELLVLRGEPGLALIGSGMDAITKDYDVAEAPARGSKSAAVGRRLRCDRGTFSILVPQELRERIGAGELATQDHGDDHGKEDPAG